MATVAADRHLLLGLIALQIGIINQGQLLAAFQAWTLDGARAWPTTSSPAVNSTARPRRRSAGGAAS